MGQLSVESRKRVHLKGCSVKEIRQGLKDKIYHMEGNFGGGKIWRIGCEVHNGAIKFGESSHP